MICVLDIIKEKHKYQEKQATNRFLDLNMLKTQLCLCCRPKFKSLFLTCRTIIKKDRPLTMTLFLSVFIPVLLIERLRIAVLPLIK